MIHRPHMNGENPPPIAPPTYLRVVATTRCNLSCSYCHGEGDDAGGGQLEKARLLPCLQVAADKGIRKFKFLGGDPLVRADLPEIIAAVRSFAPFADISLITAGSQKAEKADEVFAAGLAGQAGARGTRISTASWSRIDGRYSVDIEPLLPGFGQEKLRRCSNAQELETGIPKCPSPKSQKKSGAGWAIAAQLARSCASSAKSAMITISWRCLYWRHALFDGHAEKEKTVGKESERGLTTDGKQAALAMGKETACIRRASNKYLAQPNPAVPANREQMSLWKRRHWQYSWRM